MHVKCRTEENFPGSNEPRARQEVAFLVGHWLERHEKEPGHWTEAKAERYGSPRSMLRSQSTFGETPRYIGLASRSRLYCGFLGHRDPVVSTRPLKE